MKLGYCVLAVLAFNAWSCQDLKELPLFPHCQVMKGLSTDGEEGNLIKRSNGDDHLKEMAESSSHSEVLY